MRSIFLSGTKDGQKIQTAADEIEVQFCRKYGKSAESRRRAHDISQKIVEIPADTNILEQARADIKDTKFVDAALRDWLKVMAPEYEMPSDLHIEFVTTKEGLLLLGRIDFDRINEIYHRHIPASHSSMTPAYLLSQFLEARKELSFAATSNSDLWTSNGLSAILKHRVDRLISKAAKAKRDIEYFHDIEFEGRSFREKINERKRSGVDLIALLKDNETQKFKAWLAAQEPDGRLIKEYDRAVFTRHGWTQRLPFKVGKIAAFAGLGALVDIGLGTMGIASLAATVFSAGTDIAVDASDEFLLSKIRGGWKPNQFIEGPAKTFLAPTSQ